MLCGAAITYTHWGYERHLAVEAYPIANARIDPTYRFGIEYRKKYPHLPGQDFFLVAVSKSEIAAIRSESVRTFDWKSEDLRGTTYSFVADIEPLALWTERAQIDQSILVDHTDG